MDFNDTPEEAAFRAEARAWLDANAPAHEVPEGIKLDDADEVRRGRAWQRALYDGGFAGITLPKVLGGRGGTVIEAVVFAEEEARHRLPKGPYMGIGLGMAIPVIGKHGDEAQRAQFIDRTLRGELTWCQLFSEPSAGSDLANLRTKAVRDGDDWIVNGQKVWSSWAHESDWGILVVRTDATVPKHKGLTFFVVDMKTPGIEVRPIRQISGASDFNETFLTDVRIPDANRIGAIGEGWACCMTVLMGERLGSGSSKSAMTPIIEYAAATRVVRGPRSRVRRCGWRWRMRWRRSAAANISRRGYARWCRAAKTRVRSPAWSSSLMPGGSSARLASRWRSGAPRRWRPRPMMRRRVSSIMITSGRP